MAHRTAAWTIARATAIFAIVGLGIVTIVRREPPAAGTPIVLIVVDTLRADHVSCYGYDRRTTPSICALADDGALFERAYTPRTETTPAISSIFTGLSPHRHGIRRLHGLLPEVHVTLAELLRDHGFRTGAFVSSFVMVAPFSGFAQGFDVYDDHLIRSDASGERFERPARETVERSAAWLASAGARAFLFVHLIEPHGPYTPVQPFADRFALPAVGARADRVPMPPYQRIPELRFVSEYIGRYDGEIAAADDEIGRLLARLRALGWYDSATIIVTADHGESMGEGGKWFQHGFSVDDAEAHVPLIVKFAAGAQPQPQRGTRVREPVSILDVFSTIAAEAGVAARTGWDLRAAALGAKRESAPLTEYPSGETLKIAAHGVGCDVHWSIPNAALGPEGLIATAAEAADWPRLATSTQRFPGDASAECEAAVTDAAAATIVDMLTYRRTFSVVRRREQLEPGFRAEFFARREASGDQEIPLNERERNALRQLGYGGTTAATP